MQEKKLKNKLLVLNNLKIPFPCPTINECSQGGIIAHQGQENALESLILHI